MSFGSSLKFNVESHNGKPSILWQQEKQQKKPRKYGYKSKDLRHPVRQPADENFHNNKNAEEQNDEKKEEKKEKRKDFIKRNREKFNENKKLGSNSNQAEKGTVTLTQDQLNAILESVGKIAAGKGKGLRINIDNESNELKIEKPDSSVEVSENVDPNTAELTKSDEKPNEMEDKNKTEGPSDKKEGDNKKMDKQDKEVDKTAADSESEISLPPPIPWAHLTVAEKKRLQWARERGETSQPAYDPWGRPGAGAPLRTETGQVFADLSKTQGKNTLASEEPKTTSTVDVSTKHVDSHNDQSHQSGGAQMTENEKIPPPAMRSSMVIGHVAPDENRYNTSKDQEKKKWLEELEKQREEQRMRKLLSRERLRDSSENDWADRFSQKNEVPSQEMKKEDKRAHVDNVPGVSHHQAVDYDQNLPPAIRSSFPVGSGTPNDTKILELKAEEKRKYLKDLERQIEQRNQQKMKEQELERMAEHWAERSSHGPPVVDVFDGEVTGRTSSAPHPATSLETDEMCKHLRGQHIVLDPVTHRELEEKKRRHLEYQDAVRHQIEEKQKQKHMERERKRLEEMEEELKLQKQRDVLQKQYEEEQNKLKNKEEDRQHKIDQLKSAMDEARENAQREKVMRRLQRLEQGGHDVSYLKAQLQTMSPRGANIESTNIPELDLTARTSYNQLVTHLPEISTRNTDIMFGQYNHEPYITDRVLTPCRYREPSQPHCEPGSPRRDFGTQTLDGLVLSQINLAREPSDVQIVYRKTYESQFLYEENLGGPIKSVKKEVEKRDVKRLKNREKLKPGDVKWNYQNRKNKKVIKQSERDPFYEMKQSESEVRRAKRKQKLMALVEANKDVIPSEKHSKSRDPSPEKNEQLTRSRRMDQSPERNEQLARSRRMDQSHSPDRTANVVAKKSDRNLSSNLQNPVESSSEERLDSRPRKTHKSRPTERRASPVQNSDRNLHQQQQQQQMPVSHSPPVPALKHKMSSDTVPGKQAEILKIGHTDTYDNDYNVDSFNYTNYEPLAGDDQDMGSGGNYTDLGPDYPIYRGDFIPFTRTADILDPTKAADPIPLSRETTRVMQARQAYTKNQAPGSFGSRLDYVQDDPRKSPVRNTNNPLINPGLLKDHPTARQDLILQQLSTLKQSLRQRQRELETCMSPSDFDQ
ncbi:coiled-coil domain-containing protein 66-like [Gigantopelta aegis]|uniref:coiled-coil domain-containing protein 66-like n=1 Tax=Gigantopelta aegis TaxID=1735272 RepID=UPI001B889E3D|nr:coiled-coil domain-containing protein 66-like [Gigantopelta aegis]